MKTYKLLTINETARRLGVDRDTVRRWVSVGTLKAVQVRPDRYRIPEAELLRLVGVSEDGKHTQ